MPSLRKPTDLVVIPAEWLRDTLDAAVRRGRMTRDDAADLLAELLRGRRDEEPPADAFPLAGYDDLTAAQVIDAHTSTVWRVGFSGFAPGFAYLVDGDARLRVPRRSEPPVCR